MINRNRRENEKFLSVFLCVHFFVVGGMSEVAKCVGVVVTNTPKKERTEEDLLVFMHVV